MRRISITTALFVVIAATMMFSLAATAAPADPWGCQDLADYQYAVAMAADEDDRDIIMNIFGPGEGVEDLSTRELLEASEAIANWRDELMDFDDDDIPDAAEPQHEALIETLSLLSSFMRDYATFGPMSALAYADRLAYVEQLQLEAEDFGAEKCGELWYDVFGPEDDTI